MNEGEREYIHYRVARAEATLEAASLLLQKNLLHDTVNRLYYACFHAVTALLLTESMHSSKHKGVRSLLDKHWVRTKRLPLPMGRFYRQLFDLRHDADYEDLIDFNQSEVETWFRQATEFVAEVKKRILGQPNDAPNPPD